ncbi:hypothetical protein HMPREF9999_01562, partial [Alloprevotella sp. oral taxon 473 str. F0040]
QFTQPKRAATDLYCYIEDWANVSIHAAQAGCDSKTKPTNSFWIVSIHAAQAGCDYILAH